MADSQLDDHDVDQLIRLLKYLFKKYEVDLSSGQTGSLRLYTDGSSEFILDYFTSKHRKDKMSINLRERESSLALVRVNIDPVGFHNNADGTRIRGNRMMLFSIKEFIEKADGATYVRVIDLPVEFSEPSNIEKVFLDFLVYIHVKQEGKLIISSELGF